MFLAKEEIMIEISGSHCGDYEDDVFLGCSTV
jgi:hypothetical protein